jgi:transcriptional regulator with XRE-family HTH domain
MDEKILGIRLKQLREKTGLSQAKFAKELGEVSQPVIARYETGDFFPSYPVLIKIADYFNVSTEYLLGRTDNPAGKLYDCPNTEEERIDDFIEMCFDPL